MAAGTDPGNGRLIHRLPVARGSVALLSGVNPTALVRRGQCAMVRRITISSEVIPANSQPSFTNPFIAQFM